MDSSDGDTKRNGGGESGGEREREIKKEGESQKEEGGA